MSGCRRTTTRERLLDAGLAAGALVVVLLVAVALGVRGRPLLLAGGVVGYLVSLAGTTLGRAIGDRVGSV